MNDLLEKAQAQLASATDLRTSEKAKNTETIADRHD